MFIYLAKSVTIVSHGQTGVVIDATISACCLASQKRQSIRLNVDPAR